MGVEGPAGAVVAVGPDGGHGGRAVREEVELFGWPEQMLGCRHRPTADAAAGVVICLGAPFGPALDQGRAARLGRRLAEAGVAVQRFHPRGSAPSDGDPAAVSFASLVDDAARALDLLRDRTGVERVGVVGVRLGALVAARLAQRDRSVPVAVWEPVVDPLAMVEHAAAARAAALHPTASSEGRDPSGLTVGPGDTRPPDLFETALCGELIDRAAVGDLGDELRDRSGGLLVVQTGPGEALVPAYQSLVDMCRAHQVAVEARCHPCDAERDGTVVPGASPDALVDTTASWLAARLLPAVAAPPPPSFTPPGSPTRT
jgi:pimeloyl-ACP methyl ester carboxylesterase